MFTSDDCFVLIEDELNLADRLLRFSFSSAAIDSANREKSIFEVLVVFLI